MANAMVDEAVTLLIERGFKPVIKQGRHYKVQWMDNGNRRMLVIARSPSDFRAVRNNRAVLRRLIRNSDIQSDRSAAP
jgi:hypothetical protein